jgi:hypothetical protein
MVLRGAGYRGWGGPGWPAAGLAGLALVLASVGCNPIESYRSLNGVADNDPDPATAPFSQNLAAGEAGLPEPRDRAAPAEPGDHHRAAEADADPIAERTETQSDALAGCPPPDAGG